MNIQVPDFSLLFHNNVHNGQHVNIKILKIWIIKISKGKQWTYIYNNALILPGVWNNTFCWWRNFQWLMFYRNEILLMQLLCLHRWKLRSGEEILTKKQNVVKQDEKHVRTGQCYETTDQCYVTTDQCYVTRGQCYVTTGWHYGSTCRCYVTTGHCDMTIWVIIITSQVIF